MCGATCRLSTLFACLQIKLIKLLGMLGAGDQSAAENMYGVIGAAMQKAALHGNTIGNAIVYEAARAITTMYPNANLLQSGAVQHLLLSAHHLALSHISSLRSQFGLLDQTRCRRSSL